MSDPKLTAEEVARELRAIDADGISYLTRDEALALLERYTAQVRNDEREACEKEAADVAAEIDERRRQLPLGAVYDGPGLRGLGAAAFNVEGLRMDTALLVQLRIHNRAEIPMAGKKGGDE